MRITSMFVVLFAVDLTVIVVIGFICGRKYIPFPRAIENLYCSRFTMDRPALARRFMLRTVSTAGPTEKIMKISFGCHDNRANGLSVASEVLVQGCDYGSEPNLTFTNLEATFTRTMTDAQRARAANATGLLMEVCPLNTSFVGSTTMQVFEL